VSAAAVPVQETQPPLVRMRGIRKGFPGAQALDGVDLTIRRGEVHALAGENGSGKSTLAKILYGALKPDAGVIELDGQQIAFASPREALEQGIVAISQELTLAPTLSVAENILMGRLPRRGRVVDWHAANEQAREALDRLAVKLDPRVRVGTLSIELQQEVEVARAISADSRLLVLDEATSSLSEAATEHLLERVEQLRSDGVAILFISHRMRELYRAAQRATVLRDGALVGEVPLPETPEAQLVRMMVGREIRDLYAKRSIEKSAPVLAIRNLSTVDGAVRGATLTIRAGEILGVAGLVGCGKSELGLALFGAVPHTGTIEVDGRAAQLASPAAAIRAGIGYVPEDRKRSALFLTRSVGENITAASLGDLSRFGLLDVFRERRVAEQAAERFAVKTRSLDASIVELSGGNQQKVVLGRWFALHPKVIVLGEPTRGIDVGAKSEVYRFIQDMAEAGVAVLMISSEMPELIGLADRVLVMYHGQIRAEFAQSEADEEAIAHVALTGNRSEEAA
jgi:ABC-type sugar transport system ATPase subunit